MARIVKIFVFKIVLDGTWPEIWRRIHVPGKFNFQKLEHMIRTAMDWPTDEFHEIEIKHPVS